RLEGADSSLVLFEADIYEPDGFEAAIQGCEFVFLVVSPFEHNPHKQKGTGNNIYVYLKTKYQNITEAAVAGVRNILKLCELSGSVRRVIYTGSVTASSPLKEDGAGFNHTIDESCWTPLNLSFSHCEDHEKAYTSSKTLAEKEALSYNNLKEKEGMEVVNLACGLHREEQCYRQLEFLQGLLGSEPLVHVDDVCEAHIFCMEKPSMAGRFLCANYVILFRVEDENPERIIKYTSRKLEDFGFRYKYEMEQILDDSIKCMKRLGIH
ncbi:Anthocyanidin reductase protein, partial [Dioscorea alata]